MKDKEDRILIQAALNYAIANIDDLVAVNLEEAPDTSDGTALGGCLSELNLEIATSEDDSVDEELGQMCDLIAEKMTRIFNLSGSVEGSKKVEGSD